MPNADTKDTLMKLTVLTNILTPYRIPLFQAMAEQVDDFSVLLMAEREENRQWELQQPPFKVQVLPAFQIKPKGSEISRHWNYTVIRTLRKLQPDVVLSGGFAPANISAFLYCKMFRKAFIGWGELTLQEPSNASFVRRIIRRLLISLSNGSIASSCAARETFLHYGALPEQVLTVTLPLDVIQLRKRVEEIRKTPRFHEKQPSVSRPVLLSIGRVTKLKGYQELFDTYDQLLTTHPTTSLIIVGDGPDRKYFEDLANQRGWSNIYFIGFVQPEELATYFALSDAFVFFTLYDQFGLVLSEAMAAGVPVVSSIHAVATLELVEEGVTGFRIDPANSAASTETIRRLFNMPSSERARLVQAAYQRVLPCDFQSSAKTMVEFLRAASAGPQPQRDEHPGRHAGVT